MKLHINEVGKLLAKAREHKKSASPWQATAIDRVDPLLREIAANTESVIRYLNENPKRLALQEFREYVEVSSDSSARKADLIGDFVSYGNSKNRMESLATKLELSSSKR
jgi:hypothetical protein